MQYYCSFLVDRVSDSWKEGNGGMDDVHIVSLSMSGLGGGHCCAVAEQLLS